MLAKGDTVKSQVPAPQDADGQKAMERKDSAATPESPTDRRLHFVRLFHSSWPRADSGGGPEPPTDLCENIVQDPAHQAPAVRSTPNPRLVASSGSMSRGGAHRFPSESQVFLKSKRRSAKEKNRTQLMVLVPT